LSATNDNYLEVDRITRIFVTVIVMTGTFMAILDTTIVDVVIPKMMAPLKTDLYGIQWVITAYMTAAATGLLLTQYLDKVLGLKRLFLTGLFIFTIASVSCGIAKSLGFMIFSRVVQGLGEAFIVATAQTIMFSVYPQEKRGIAMGIYGMGVSFAPALGPMIGGWLTEHLTWRWVFFVNLPIGMINILLGILLLPKLEKYKEKIKFNFVSYIFLAIFTVSILVMLSKGQQYGWFQSNLIIILLVSGILAFILYLITEINSKNKLIDFALFKIKEYRYALLIYFFTLGFSIYQIFYMIPLYYENLKKLTTFQTGLHMLAFAIFIGFLSPLAGYLSDKFGEKYVLLVNAIIYFFTSIVLIPKLNYYTPSIRTILLTIPLGLSLGTFFAPITTLAMRNLGALTSLGVAVLQYSRFMGGSFGTAIATNTLQSKIAFHYDEISAIQNFSYLKKYVTSVADKLELFMSPDIALLKAKALIYYVQNLMSLSHSFQDVFRHAGYYGMFGLSFLIFFFIGKEKK